jgi:hypothetical protein
MPLGPEDSEGTLSECGSLEIESREGQLNKDNTSDEKAPEQAGAKKPYKTPSVRFESVFEVSALSCGKVSDTQASCKVSMKAS